MTTTQRLEHALKEDHGFVTEDSPLRPRRTRMPIAIAVFGGALGGVAIGALLMFFIMS